TVITPSPLWVGYQPCTAWASCPLGVCTPPLGVCRTPPREWYASEQRDPPRSVDTRGGSDTFGGHDAAANIPNDRDLSGAGHRALLRPLQIAKHPFQDAPGAALWPRFRHSRARPRFVRELSAARRRPGGAVRRRVALPGHGPAPSASGEPG